MEVSPKLIEDLLAHAGSGNLIFDTKHVDKEYVHKEYQNQVLISPAKKITKAFPEIAEGEEISNIFYTNALPNFNCSFIFDHKQEHYPFILLFEAVRQLAMSISHQFYSVPLEGYCNTLNNVKFDLELFCELDQPLMLICIDKVVKEQRILSRRELKFLFFQNNKLCATGDTEISIMTKLLYQRFRLSSRNKVLEVSTKDYKTIPSNVNIMSPMI